MEAPLGRAGWQGTGRGMERCHEAQCLCRYVDRSDRGGSGRDVPQ